MNRQQRRMKEKRNFSNKKGIQLTITRLGNTFYKYKKEFQNIGNKRILHYVD